MDQTVQEADRRKPEADHPPPAWQGVALKLATVAAFAVAVVFLVLVMIDEAQAAQWTPSPAPTSAPAPAPSAPPSAAAPNPFPAASAADECVNCYLGPQHDAYYRAYLQALENRIGSAPTPVDLTPLTTAADRAATAAERAAAAAERAAKAAERSATASEATRDEIRGRSPENWIWTFGVALSGAAIVQNGEPTTPWLTRAEGFIRVVDPDSHLGGEVGGGGGVWGASGHRALAVGGHAAVLASWDMFALLLGADLAQLQAPEEGAPGLLLGTAFLAPELHGDSFFVRLLGGATTKSEDARTSGLVLGLTVGWHTQPD